MRLFKSQTWLPNVQSPNANLDAKFKAISIKFVRRQNYGRAGTIATYTLAKRHPAGGSLSVQTTMEGYDEATHTYIMDLQGDQRYSHMRFHVSFLPGPSSGTSLGKWFVDYIPVDAQTPAPEHLLEVVTLMFEKLGAQVHPQLLRIRLLWLVFRPSQPKDHSWQNNA